LAILFLVVIPSKARDLQLTAERRYFVYIVASQSLNLYTGITDNIYRRALEHKNGTVEGFTKRYNINRLVYYETFKYVNNAIAREKQVKAWTRAKRIALIKSLNPAWQDLRLGRKGRTAESLAFARDDSKSEEQKMRMPSVHSTGFTKF
jgi:putative endonuclease